MNPRLPGLCTCLAAAVVGACSHRDRTPTIVVEPPTFATRFQRAIEREPWTLEALPPATAAFVADIDGDGVRDALIAHASSDPDLVWGPIADGHAAVAPIVTGGAPRAVAALDVDGDGDLDLVSAPDAAQEFSLTEQIAPRVFLRRPLLPGVLAGDVRQFAVLDFDRDGRDDLAVARDFGSMLLRNDGLGGFVDVTSTLPADTRATWAVATGPLLGGIGPDLVFGGPQGFAALRNDGGTFTDVTLQTIGVLPWTPYGVAIADVDNDGDGDLIVRASQRVLWLAGDGGTLPLTQTLNAFGVGALQLVDDDGDLDLDLAVAAGDDGVRLFRFDAVAHEFAGVVGAVVPTLGAVDAVLGWQDLDGDARPDLLVAQASPRAVWQLPDGRYQPDALLTQPSFAYPIQGAGAVLAADVDEDGSLDLVDAFTGPGVAGSRLLRNDGSGRFTSQAIAVGLPFAAADVDLDGHVDLLSFGWYPGDGTGAFGAAREWPGNPGGVPVLGDFDGDGIPEVLMLDGTSAVRFDPATGGPIASRNVLTTDVDPDRLVVGDVDGDGVDDVVVVHVAAPNRLLLGSPNGFIDQSGALPGENVATGDVAIGDWNGDGIPDLIVAHRTLDSNELGRVYLADGHGGFVRGDALLSNQTRAVGISRVVAADVDEDGRAEVFVHVATTFGAAAQARVEVFEAAGVDGRAFEVPPHTVGVDGISPFAGSYAPQFVDLDGDRDLDALGQELRSNGLRDIVFRNRVRLGGTVTLGVVDRGYTAGENAIVVLSIAPSNVPLPGLGVGLVDPSLGLLASTGVAAAGGMPQVVFTLPAVPFVGVLPLYAQAVLVDGNGAVRALTTRAQANTW